MKLLLDTHIWIWSQEAIDNIGTNTFSLLKNTENILYVSPISTLEIARLIQLKRIQLSCTLKKWVSQSLNNLLCKTLPLSHEIAIESYSLHEPFQRDPADRIIVAEKKPLYLCNSWLDLTYSNVKNLPSQRISELLYSADLN
ncbi:hypothetical protein ES703_70867 [subsurface metagenome]